MDSEKRIFFAAKALIVHDSKFLIMHKNGLKEDWWEIPGGRMEFGETAEETVMREVFEETGLTVRPVRILDTWNSVMEDYQITGIIYLCKLEMGTVKLSSEHDKYQWIPFEKSSIGCLHSAFKEKMDLWNYDLTCDRDWK